MHVCIRERGREGCLYSPERKRERERDIYIYITTYLPLCNVEPGFMRAGPISCSIDFQEPKDSPEPQGPPFLLNAFFQKGLWAVDVATVSLA